MYLSHVSTRSECCSVRPLVKKTTTFSIKDLRKTLSQYVTPDGITAWQDKCRKSFSNGQHSQGYCSGNILTQNVVFRFFPNSYSICLTFMSYGILDKNGTNISRRFITKVWWSRNNPYLCVVMDYDNFWKQDTGIWPYGCLFSFSKWNSNRGDVLPRHSETIRSLPKV